MTVREKGKDKESRDKLLCHRLDLNGSDRKDEEMFKSALFNQETLMFILFLYLPVPKEEHSIS